MGSESFIQRSLLFMITNSLVQLRLVQLRVQLRIEALYQHVAYSPL